MDQRIDLLLGIIVILVGAGVLVLAGDIRPTGPVVDSIGPRAFPYIIGTFFIIGGSLVTIRRIKNWAAEDGPIVETDGEPDEPDVPASAVQAFSVMAAAIIYALALPRLGYLIASPVFVVAALKAMRMKSWGVVLATAAVYTASTYIVFAYYLGVDLPLGPLAGAIRSIGLAR